MDAPKLIASLERFGRVLPATVDGVAPDDARWKPADGAWSILEVVRHLGDEEVDDFRTRLRMTLGEEGDWPPIDPEGWARDRHYNDDHLPDAVTRFVQERAKSIDWLKRFGPIDFAKVHRHPKFGDMPAGSLLGAWAAHDALHLRQLAKRLWQIAARDAAPFGVQYAGDWTA